jgi:glycosyltransferase involved in cell wall biosynthesis
VVVEREHPARTGRLIVGFPAGQGVSRWQARHASSPVPSEWPYGLDRLRDGGREVMVTELTPPSLPQQLAARLEVPAWIGRLRPRSRKADVALCWDEVTATRLLAEGPARRLFSGVIWLTDTLVRGDGDRRRLSRARTLLRQFDGLWCLSRPQVDVLREWLGDDAPPVHFVRFGIDPDFYRFVPCLPDRPRVVSVGGDRDRDPATLYPALELVRAERPDVECVVQSTSDLPAPAGVTVTPFIPHAQTRELYASASVVAVATKPNLHVSGMTVAMEAMSVGRPVVASRTPGMTDYVLDGTTGLLVAPEDPESMAAAVLQLLADRDRAQAMGTAGRQHVERDLTTNRMCQRLLDVVS